MKPKVYFSRTITPEKVLEMYKLLNKELPGKVALKVHSGEKGNQNFLGPDFWKPLIDEVGGTIVECNTAYAGRRNTTEEIPFGNELFFSLSIFNNIIYIYKTKYIKIE